MHTHTHTKTEKKDHEQISLEWKFLQSLPKMTIDKFCQQIPCPIVYAVTINVCSPLFLKLFMLS
jgi:hypothetical protein